MSTQAISKPTSAESKGWPRASGSTPSTPAMTTAKLAHEPPTTRAHGPDSMQLPTLDSDAWVDFLGTLIGEEWAQIALLRARQAVALAR